jgi:hypothetical protein
LTAGSVISPVKLLVGEAAAGRVTVPPERLVAIFPKFISTFLVIRIGVTIVAVEEAEAVEVACANVLAVNASPTIASAKNLIVFFIFFSF